MLNSDPVYSKTQELAAKVKALAAQEELMENWLKIAHSKESALEPTLRNTLAVAIRLTDAESGSFFLLSKDNAIQNRVLIRQAASAAEQERLVQGVMDKGLAGWVAQNRETGLIHDTLQDQRWTTLPDEPYHVRSALGVPIMRQSDLMGVLTLIHAQPAHFTSEHVQLMHIVTAQMALILDNAQIYNHLQQELQRREIAEAALQQANNELEDRVQARTAELAIAHHELRTAYEATLEGWARALELRDYETQGHSQRVTEMAVALAKAIGVSGNDLEYIRWGALLHDIGKMGIPDSILLKPAQLTDLEQEQMREHPQYAYEMLSRINYLRPALDIPYYHHEKWDGTGYPLGLEGDQIPLAARIFAVVDVWDALTSKRPYRPAWSTDKAYCYISELAGTHFDPEIVKVFLQTIS